ncbi:substrate-binding domain-containing protein [Jannaschia ovalis]|uniref:Substrate-binding domain-containing protein n=1 Tax=Jannaschia ovalis TaxID=3038773 RepID=A0ABY8LDH6_9RHOB|nr:substrate-binding domain-containing protein [Jannaschia sp. GRR-S6-38]WGH78662.1 substrate-binding domain-containing protein [Jannaschia sp. GRR-S6-38]
MNLKEFAQSLGLSPTTVSRALGGYPEVGAETRRRILREAAARGYRPNRRAAALATGRAMAIGHVIATSQTHEMVNPVFADFIAGAGEVYAAAGYDILMSVVSDGDELSAYRQMVEAGTVDGVMLHGPRQGDARIGVMQEIGVPFVVHGRDPSAPLTYDFVDIANTRAFRGATERLLALGHRRIGLVNGLPALDFARRRQAGFVAALEAAGIAPDPRLIRGDEMSEQFGHAAAAGMLAGPDRPTAFLVSSIIMAVGVRRAIHEAGLSLPGDVSMIIHDDALSYITNAGDPPPFAATRSPVRAAGRRCAEILLGRIARPAGRPVQEVWDCETVDGASLGPAP